MPNQVGIVWTERGDLPDIFYSTATTAEHLQQFTLLVNREGTGSGSVTSRPPGIDCGTDCEEVYLSGTQVTLMASPSQERGK